MDKTGILLYGYSEADAMSLRKAVEDCLNRDIVLLSASGMEEKTLQEVLELAECSNFEENGTPIMMFLAFSDEDIQKALQAVSVAKVKRPIFCTPTNENIHWPLKALIEHLRVEDSYWKGRKS